jgi:hypothetical protein
MAHQKAITANRKSVTSAAPPGHPVGPLAARPSSDAIVAVSASPSSPPHAASVSPRKPRVSRWFNRMRSGLRPSAGGLPTPGGGATSGGEAGGRQAGRASVPCGETRSGAAPERGRQCKGRRGRRPGAAAGPWVPGAVRARGGRDGSRDGLRRAGRSVTGLLSGAPGRRAGAGRLDVRPHHKVMTVKAQKRKERRDLGPPRSPARRPPGARQVAKRRGQGPRRPATTRRAAPPTRR